MKIFKKSGCALTIELGNQRFCHVTKKILTFIFFFDIKLCTVLLCLGF